MKLTKRITDKSEQLCRPWPRRPRRTWRSAAERPSRCGRGRAPAALDEGCAGRQSSNLPHLLFILFCTSRIGSVIPRRLSGRDGSAALVQAAW
jgi:hypothetical protein